jgi:hypothetical protein
VDLVTALEQAVLDAGEVFRSASFGAALQRYHPGRRGGAAGVVADPLLMFEVNESPAIIRTFKVLDMHARAGAPLDITPVREYVDWVAAAARAIQRLAQLLWQPIPVPIRTAVFDEDDLGPGTSSYLPKSRFDEIGPALRFEELDGQLCREAWRTVSRESRSTDCYNAAREAAERLKRQPLHNQLNQHRRDILARLQAAVSGGPITIGDAQARQQEIVRDAYIDSPIQLREAAYAIRAYNELVNHILWAVLGIAESTDEVVAFTRNVGAVRVSGRGRNSTTTITMEALKTWVGHPPSPYVIEAGLPIDGLYLSRGNLVQIAVTDMMLDLTGRRLGDLELGL